MAVESSAVGAGAAAGTSGDQRLKAGQLSLPNCFALSAAVMAPVHRRDPERAGRGARTGRARCRSRSCSRSSVPRFRRQHGHPVRQDGCRRAGSFYTFCSHALGSGAGFYTGWLYFGRIRDAHRSACSRPTARSCTPTCATPVERQRPGGSSASILLARSACFSLRSDQDLGAARPDPARLRDVHLRSCSR